MKLIWEIRHLFILVILLIGVGWGAVLVRDQMLPETYGDAQGRYGPYRAAALDTLKSQPSFLVPQATCEKCHTDVQEERAGTMHEAVACTSCHGPGREHTKQALLAEKDDSIEITPPGEWDGNPHTDMEFYKAPHRAMCLSCHESVVGMPKDFKQIVVALHLEDQGASEPDAIDTCFECHGYHDTAP